MSTPAAPLEFELRDDDPWHISERAFEILTEFVSGTAAETNTDAAVTAAELNSLSPAKRTLNDGETAEETTSFLLEFWQVFVLVAKQIPCDSRLQGRAVQLVQALKALPADGDAPRIWVHLEGLEIVLQQSWRTPFGDDDSDAPFTDWVNVNAFVAQLYAAGVVPWYYLGIWTLREAFEKGEETNKDVRESYISASAQWMLHAGSNLCRLFEEHTASEVEMGPLSSALFGGDEVFSQKRLQFWLDKFALAGESIPAAAEAAEAMFDFYQDNIYQHNIYQDDSGL